MNNRITVRSVSWLLLLVSSLHIILMFVLKVLFTFFQVEQPPEWLSSLVNFIPNFLLVLRVRAIKIARKKECVK